jgi:hypothetical protein
MSVEQSAEWVAEDTEVPEENSPQYPFVHHKSHLTWTGLETRQPRWEASD